MISLHFFIYTLASPLESKVQPTEVNDFVSWLLYPIQVRTGMRYIPTTSEKPQNYVMLCMFSRVT